MSDGFGIRPPRDGYDYVPDTDLEARAGRCTVRSVGIRCRWGDRLIRRNTKEQEVLVYQVCRSIGCARARTVFRTPSGKVRFGYWNRSRNFDQYGRNQ